MKLNTWYELPDVQWAYMGRRYPEILPLRVMEIEAAQPDVLTPIRRFMILDYRRTPMPLDQDGELNGFICQLVCLNRLVEVKGPA